jgi:hypothetical protein
MLNLTAPQNQAVPRELGAAYFRPGTAVKVESWDGHCPQCEAAQQLGLQLILTVRNNGGPDDPTTPPTDLAVYRATLGQILDAYPPEVLVVENEENNSLFYIGAPEIYGLQLAAACEVAHSRQIACANGGLVSGELALLVWDNYRTQGNMEAACSFATRAFDPADAQLLCAAQTQPQLPEALTQMIAKGQAFLAVYGNAGMDYMNFHWYIPDTLALAEAADFLHTQVGLPLMTNEMGERDDDPATVQALMQKSLDLNLAYVVWFSIDAAQARALNNADGSLRPTGEAFRDFIRVNFQ